MMLATPKNTHTNHLSWCNVSAMLAHFWRTFGVEVFVILAPVELLTSEKSESGQKSCIFTNFQKLRCGNLENSYDLL